MSNIVFNKKLLCDFFVIVSFVLTFDVSNQLNKTMRKLSLLFIFLILLSGLVNAENSLQQSNRKRKVPVKSTTGVPVFRSPIYSPVQVFICGNVLMVDFQEPIKGVFVKIKNIDTNETILFKSYDVQVGTIINIPIYECGMFKISFSTDIYQGYGEFMINEL